MRKHATPIIITNGPTVSGTTVSGTAVLVDLLIVSPVLAHPCAGGGLLSLRPRGA